LERQTLRCRSLCYCEGWRDLALIDEVHSGRGHQSRNGTRSYFGLGNHSQVDRIAVRLIGGDTDMFEKVVADQLVTLIEACSQMRHK